MSASSDWEATPLINQGEYNIGLIRKKKNREESWKFPGEGKVEWLEPTNVDLDLQSMEAPHHLLGQWTSTAISGNDITSRFVI
jgi:hypothetical protein